MKALRLVVILLALAVCVCDGLAQKRYVVVADSITRTPLVNASVFNCEGVFIGNTREKGLIRCANEADYPLTVRYLGYYDEAIPLEAPDTVFLKANVAELPEIVVETKRQQMLHILAYVREYSTLSNYTDTVTMFREKMVDFMLPKDDDAKYQGWRNPRVLNVRSYYRFTNANGLDSVSDRCNHHFSWSDWIGMMPNVRVPSGLAQLEQGIDTVRGKYGASEIWMRNGDRTMVDIDVLADANGRKWVPNLSSFFRNDDIDFERFHMRLNYGTAMGDDVGPLDLAGYSFNIESRGRGRTMFMFNRSDEPFFVTTYTEAYILDKEFITVKEAKKWESRKFDEDEIEIFEPLEASELQSSTLALIDRVNNIDQVQIRIAQTPDHRLMSRHVSKKNFKVGYRALSLLKQMTGISQIKSNKNFKENWKKFKKEQQARNQSRELHEPESTEEESTIGL